MAVLSGLRLVRLETLATDTGVVATGTDSGLLDAPTAHDFPLEVRAFYEAYAGPDVYPTLVVSSFADQTALEHGIEDLTTTATDQLVAGGNSFA